MKVNWNKLFSISVSEEVYFNDQKDKIEFVGCNLSGERCLDYLPQINEFFRESDRFHRAKDFNRAIDALEHAYGVAEEIKEPECQRCAMFFKATVIQSLESLHVELEKMGRGIFSTRRYDSCCLKAEGLLMRLTAKKGVNAEYSITDKSLSLQPAYML